MSKYQYGGYCPKCVQPVDATHVGMNCILVGPGQGIMCCPACGAKAPGMPTTQGYFVQWPQGAVRLACWPWWARWEVKIDAEAKP